MNQKDTDIARVGNAMNDGLDPWSVFQDVTGCSEAEACEAITWLASRTEADTLGRSDNIRRLIEDLTVREEADDDPDCDDFLYDDVVLRHPPISSRRMLLVDPAKFRAMKQEIVDLKAQVKALKDGKEANDG